MLDGHEDHFTNNKVSTVEIFVYFACSDTSGNLFASFVYLASKVVMTGSDLGSQTCSGPGTTIINNNEYYTPTGKLTECKMDLADWQAQGHDQGSTVAQTPDHDTIISWGREVLAQ